MLPRALLQQLLSDAQPSAGEELQVTRSERGPGYLSKMLLLEGKTNAWQQMEYKPTTVNKRKIIISNNLLNEIDSVSASDVNKDRCRDLIQALIDNYDVYLWPGTGKSLKDVRPVNSTEEFWQRRNEIHQTNNQNVTESLSDQGLSSSDYIVIDYVKYIEILGKMKITDGEYEIDMEAPPQIFNTLNEMLNIDEYLHLLEPYKNDITAIIISQDSISNAQKILQTLPKLQRIEIDCSDINTLDLSVFNDMELQLTCDKMLDEQIKFSQPCNFKKFAITKADADSIDFGPMNMTSLSISNCGNLKNIIVPLSEKLAELTITKCNSLSGLNDLDLTGIKKLTIKNCFNLKDLDLSKFTHLEELEIVNCPNLASDIVINSSIKSLTIKTTPANKITLRNPGKLLKCDLDFREIKQIEGLERAVELKTLHMEGLNINHHVDYSKLKSLEELVIDNSELPEHLDLSTIKLTALHINNSSTLNSISTGQQLKSLAIVNCDKLSKIDSSGSNHLEKMILMSCPNLVYDINNPSLIELSVLSCNQISDIKLNELPNLRSIICEHYEKIVGTSTNLTSLTVNIDSSEFDGARFTNLDKFEVNSANNELDIKNLGSKLHHVYVNGNVNSIDLSQCRNLTHATFKHTNADIDLSSCLKLRSLHIESQCKSLTGLNAEDMDEITLEENLKYVYELDFSRIKSINKIELRDIKIRSLDLAHAKIGSIKIFNIRMPFMTMNLSQLHQVYSVEITRVDTKYSITLPEHPENIQKLILSDDLAKNLDLSGWYSLEFLKLNINNLDKLVLPDISSLQSFKLEHAKVTSLDLRNQKQLQLLMIYRCNDLEKLTASHLPNLKKLTTNNLFSKPNSSVDVSRCEDLRSLSIDQNAGCEVNIKDCKKLYLIPYGNKVTFVNTDPNVKLPWSLVQQAPSDDAHASELHASEKENRQLNEYNQSNPVSVFNFKKSIKVDGDTNGKPTVNATGDFKFVAFGKKPIPKNNYRMNVIDDVQYNPRTGELNYTTKDRKLTPVNIANAPLLTIDTLAKLKAEAAADDKYTVSYLEGTLEKDEIYPLPTPPTSDKKDFQIYIEPKDSIDLFWDEEHRQHCMRLKANAATNKIKLAYRNKNTDVKNLHNPVYSDNTPLLPKYLVDELTRRLNYPNSPVAFVFDKSKSIDERIKLLKHYCRFDLLKLSSKPVTDIDTLCKIITEHKGVCRHRTNAFFMLARLIGVPASIISNEVHEFIEVPLRDGKEIVWQSHDLGGGDLLDLTPKGVRENIFDNVPNVPAPVIAKSAPRQPTTQTIPVKVREYVERFSAIADEHELKSLWQLIDTPQIKSGLIKLRSDQNPLDVNKQIISQLKQHNYPVTGKHIYIHTPEDFAHYLKPWVFKDGKYVRNNNGPLAELIKSSGVLVVNWSNFTPTEIASYKSILDTTPTILGQNVSKNLLVVGLINADNKSCSSFSSRTKAWSLHRDFFRPGKIEKKPAPAITREKMHVDLFRDPTWRDELYGKEKEQGNTVILEDGPLITAIKKNIPLTIYNPPDDNDFKLLLTRIRDEGKLYYNGQWVPIPDGFTITTEKKTHKSLLPNVHIETKEAAADKPLKRIYLGLYNLHECFERSIYVDGRSKPAPDLLNQFIPGQTEIYLTESIPTALWQRLLARIEEKYPNKQFTFRLAPGVEIENIARSEIKPKLQDESHATMIVSNDSDYMTQTLADKKTLIVDLTPNMNFSDLIYETSTKERNDGSLEFNYKEKDVLRALQAGRKVILNGIMSQSLYNQLLPYLLGEKKIECNGILLDIKNQLVAVIPDSAAKKMTLHEHYRRDFSFNDYLQLFPADEDQVWLRRIHEFYQAAGKLPNRGIDRPEAFMSHQRLTHMLQLLKSSNPLHTANPLKGVFHYDYPKHSEDYAYLNVMAKYYFQSAEHNKGINHKKLQQLLKHINIDSKEDVAKHAWQLVNCLGIGFSNWLFGSGFPNDYLAFDKINNLRANAAFPALTDIAISRLQQEIKRAQFSTQPAATPAANQDSKQHRQLDSLLRDPNTFIIVLKGPAGVGKTHAVRKLLGKDKNNNYNYYEGEKGFQEWLLKGDKPFLIDEANTAMPGMYDYLKGLSRGFIYYNGVEYKLSPKHKIIATGNPENYPNRYYHRLFQEYGETLYFQKPDEYYLIKHILTPILSPYRLDKPAYIQAMLTAINLIETYNPYMIISLRDYENIAMRFIALTGQRKYRNEAGEKQALLSACLNEFAGAIKDPALRNEFAEKIQAKIGIREDAALSAHRKLELSSPEKKRQVPREKKYLIDAIEQDILMRNQAVANSRTGYFKPAILLEGNPGVGKSTLYQAIIEKHIRQELAAPGANQDEIAKRWKFYTLSAGSKEIYADLKKAFHEGAMVILDELNLDENLETLLNQYLTGFDEDGKPANNPGFMVLSSQNPGYFEGRKNLSPALRNRFHFLYMDDYTDAELAYVARGILKDEESYLQAYKISAARYPDTINHRSYFDLLAELEKEKKNSIKPTAKPVPVNVQPIPRLRPKAKALPIVPPPAPLDDKPKIK